jgi:hypothetical protein
VLVVVGEKLMGWPAQERLLHKARPASGTAKMGISA